jgi:hypothetical protein
MEEVIKYRWGALPDEQREGIKTYISNLIIKLSTDDGSFRRERTFLNKMNMILVQILKQVRQSSSLSSPSTSLASYHDDGPSWAPICLLQTGGTLADDPVVHLYGQITLTQLASNRVSVRVETWKLRPRQMLCPRTAEVNLFVSAGLATQVAVVHPRHRGCFEEQRDAVRELHGARADVKPGSDPRTEPHLDTCPTPDPGCGSTILTLDPLSAPLMRTPSNLCAAPRVVLSQESAG